MRPRDVRDWLRLRRLAENAAEIVSFRQGQRPGDLLRIRLREGKGLELRGGTQDHSIFRSVWIDDEYRLDDAAPDAWECVVDLGANVGCFAARALGLARRVIGYEPEPGNFERLKHNLGGEPRAELQREAVGAKTGTIRLHPPLDGRGSGRFTAHPRPGLHDEEESIEVACVSLDDLYRRHAIERCDLLKLDVEGAEYEILRAAGDETLARTRSIRGEYHDVPGSAAESLVAILEPRGFRVELVPGGRTGSGLFFAERGPDQSPTSRSSKLGPR